MQPSFLIHTCFYDTLARFQTLVGRIAYLFRLVCWQLFKKRYNIDIHQIIKLTNSYSELISFAVKLVQYQSSSEMFRLKCFHLTEKKHCYVDYLKNHV